MSILQKMSSNNGGLKHFKIICGNTEGHLYPSRFGPSGKSLCIKLKPSSSLWMTPIEFEKHAGKSAQHNWKRTTRSITHGNKLLLYLIDEGILKACSDPKKCQCQPCKLAKTSCVTKREKSGRDTDSDSGISVEISTNASISPPNSEFKAENLESESQVMDLSSLEPVSAPPNYTKMVQEAIYALTSRTLEPKSGNPGCSLLGIFLYILKHYPQVEHVTVMNSKIKASLALLKRMGLVKSTCENENEVEDELEIVEGNSRPESEISQEVNQDGAVKKETKSNDKKPATVKKCKKGAKSGKENSKGAFNFAQCKAKKLR